MVSTKDELISKYEYAQGWAKDIYNLTVIIVLEIMAIIIASVSIR